jgi:hypothetical protein
MNFQSNLPAYIRLKDPTIYIDHGALADRIFQLAGIAKPGGDKWEEVRDELARIVPEIQQMPV